MQLFSRFHALNLQGPLLSSLIVMGGYILSRVTGLLREIVISAQFGTSADLGAYRAAFKITDMLYMVIIGGALGSSFIPVFIQLWKQGGAERAWRLASAVVTWALVLLALASMLVWVFAPVFTQWFYGGFSPDEQILTTSLIRLFLLSPLLLGLGGLAMAALNAHDHFTLPALAPAIYNMGIIVGAWLFAPRWGIWGLAWGVLVGACFYLIVQLPGLWRMGMRFAPTLGRDIAELRTVAKHMAPRVIGQAASQLSLLVTAALTARLVQGAEHLTGLEYAYQLMLLPYGVFSLSLSTVAFPRLSRLFAEGNTKEMVQSIRRTLRMILFLTLPATVALILLAVPLVRLLFQRGAFTEISLVYTFIPLLGYATALPAFSVSEILIRSFFAMQQTRIPVAIGIGQVTLNLLLGSLVLWLGGGVGMLALAFSIANNIEALVLFLMLGRHLPGIWRDPVLWRSIRAAVLATLVLAGVVQAGVWFSLPWLPYLASGASYVWQDHLLPLAGWLVGMGLGGAIVYTSIAAVMGGEEARLIWRRLVSGATFGK